MRTGRNNGIDARLLGLLMGLLLMLPTALAAQQSIPEASPEIEELMKNIFPSGSHEREQLEDKKVPFDREDPSLYEVLEVNQPDNPMVNSQCRREAVEKALHRLGEVKGLDRDGAIEMAHMHTDGEKAKAKSGEVSYADYLGHIAECKGFCGPLVASLMECHVDAVATQEHAIVFFEYDSDVVRPLYREELIREVAGQLQHDSSKRLLLIGRASKTGELDYNRRLSGQRAKAVEDELIDLGLDKSRIRSMWFGWEEPQITERIAGKYSLARDFGNRGGQAMNQSVMVVIY